VVIIARCLCCSAVELLIFRDRDMGRFVCKQSQAPSYCDVPVAHVSFVSHAKHVITHILRYCISN